MFHSNPQPGCSELLSPNRPVCHIHLLLFHRTSIQLLVEGRKKQPLRYSLLRFLEKQEMKIVHFVPVGSFIIGQERKKAKQSMNGRELEQRVKKVIGPDGRGSVTSIASQAEQQISQARGSAAWELTARALLSTPPRD